MVECLHEYGIQQKVCRLAHSLVIKRILNSFQILGLVCDNASNNDAMVKELGVLLPSFKGQSTRVRCFAHILNLVVKVFRIGLYSPTTHIYDFVKAILSQFSKTKKASSDADEDDSEANQDSLDDLEDDIGYGDEEMDDADADDETDPSVEQSDKMAVDTVIADVEFDERLPLLTRGDVNLGRYSISKVCDTLTCVTVFTHNIL